MGIGAARTAALVAAAVLPGACGPQAALDALAAAGRGKVASVPAGDALVLADGTRVRLAGVEAPKMDEPYAAQATAALAALTAGREVELLSAGAGPDASGRRIVQVRETAHGLWLEAALLRAGAVRVRTWPDNRALAGPMLEAEAGARAARRGLWDLPAYQVRLPREIGADDRGFTVVEGRVTGVGRDGRRATLARDGGRLAADIPPSAADDFAAAALPPASLRGRLVRVRGWLTASGRGPRLRLDHPEQVELLAEPRPRRRP